MINRILPRYAKQMLRDPNEGDFNSNSSSSSTYNTFNSSQGTEKQSGVIVDVLSEGPIYGLVDDASSVLLNGVPILDPITKVNYGAKVSNNVSYVASTRTVTDNSSANIFQNRNINDGTFRIFIEGAKASGTGNISTTSGSTQITSSSSFFTQSLVGNGISIPGAGPNGSTYYGYINYRINGTNVSVYPPVSTSVSGANILVNLYEEIASFSGNTAVLKGSGTLGINVSNVPANITTPYVPTATSANRWNYEDAGFAFRSGTRDQSFLQLPSSVGTNSLTTNVSQTLNTTDFNAITYNGSPIFPSGYLASGGWEDVSEPDAARLVFTSDGMGIPSPGEVDAIKVTIKFPSGLIAVKPKDAHEQPCFAEFQILFEYSVAGDFSDTVTEAVYGLSDEQLAARTPLPGKSADSFGGYAGTFLHGGTVFKKTKTPFVQTFSFDVSKYQPFTKYRIKVAKISPTNGKNERRIWNNATQLQSIQNIITDKLSYPYTAYGAVIFGAKEFTSVPRRSYEIRGLQVKVPTNYFARHELSEGSAASYTRKVTNNTTVTNESDYQDWDGNFRGDIKTFTDPTHSNFAPVWTDNPVWILLDILTNDRYGLGKFVDPLDDFSYIDKFQLFQIAKYCDELVPDGKGGTEPRFTANLYLSKIEDAQKVVNDLLSVFRGLLIWFDGKFSPSINAYKSPVYTFTKGNVIGGEFAYQSSSRRFRSNQVRVTWNNPDDNYQQAVEIVEDTQHILETGKIISKDVVATGCTSQGQAHRFGKWNILTEKLEKEVVTFSTGLNAIALKPGDVIEVQDADRENTEHSGRVSNTGTRSTTVIPLDREISLNTSTKAYSLNLIYPKGGAYLRQENATINSTAYVLGDLVLLDEDGASIDTQQKSANVKDDSGNLVQLYWSESVRVESKAVDSFTSTSVTVSSAFSETPDADVIWSLTSTTIATGEEETDISPKEYIIIRTEEKEKNTISIAAAEYSDAKFELIDRGYTTEIVPLSQKEPLRTEIVPAVESLVASVSPSTVETSTEGSASGRADLLISWQPPLQVRESTSSTISGNVSSSTSITLSAANENIEVGMRVRHSSISGVVTVSSIDETALTVSTAVSLTSGDELSFKHDNPEPSIAGYHVTVQGPNTSDMADWQSRGNGYYKFVEAEDTIATMKGIQAGTYYIHVKAENTIKNKSASETIRINYTAEKYSFPSGQNKLLGIDLGGVLDESLSVNTSTGLVAVASSSYSFTHSNGTVFKNTSSTASTYQQSFSVLGADSTAYLLYDKGSTDTFKAVQIYTDTNVTDVDGNKLNFEYWVDINDNANNGLTTKTGTVSLSDTSATVTGTSTSFTTEYTEGDLLIVGSGASAFYAFINFIESDTIMDLDRVPTRNYSGATIKKLNFVPNFAEDQIIAKITTNGATEYSIDETYAITAGLDGEAAAAGENARSVKLTASSFVVRYNTSNTVTTNNITFVAEGHGTSGTETFRFLTKEAGDSSFQERQGFSHTPNNDQFTLADSEEPAIGGETQVKVEMNESGAASNPVASDTVTIYAIQDGAAASAGDDAVTAFLTNSAHVASTNPGGTNPSYTNAGGLFDVYVGADRRTLHNDVSFYVGATGTGTSLTQNGLTLSINNTDGSSDKGTYTLSGSSWTSTEETFTVRAVVADTVPGVSSEVVITRIYSISKSKEGQQGDQGDETVQVKVFKAVTYNASVPTTPSGGTYDFTDNTFTPPSTWSTTAPAQAYLQVVYTSVATVTGASTDTAVSPGTFTSPTIEIGVTPTSRTVYQRSATNLTTAPNNGSAIDYQTAPTGWSFTIPSGSNPLYAAFGTSTFSAANRSLTVVYGTPIKQEGVDGDPGDDAQAVKLSASSQIFELAKNGTVTPSSITFTANRQNISNSTTFATNPSVTLGGSGDTATLSNSNFGNNTAVTVTASAGGFSDSITVVKVEEGTDALVAVLGNESHTFQANNAGTVGDFSDGTTTIQVFEGATALDFQVNNGVATSAGEFTMTRALSGITAPTVANYSGDGTTTCTTGTPTAMSADSATITYTILGNRANGTAFTLTKVQSFSKSKEGDPGEDGDDGLQTVQGYLFYEKTTAGAPSAPSSSAVYRFSTNDVDGGTGATEVLALTDTSAVNKWTNEPRTNSATSSNNFYSVRYSGTQSATTDTTISVSYSDVFQQTNFSGIVTFSGGTFSEDGSAITTIDGDNITTGQIQSSVTNETSTFTGAGALFDLTNAEIKTPYFYSKDTGAGFKGTVTIDGTDLTPTNTLNTNTDVNSLVGTSNFDSMGPLTLTSTKIHTGTGTFNNSNTGFYLDNSGNFSLKDKLSFNGTTLTVNGGGTFSGALSAATGTFNGSVQIGSGTSVFKADTNGIYLGNETFGNAPFRVAPGGSVTATNITLSGEVNGGLSSGSNSSYVQISTASTILKAGSETDAPLEVVNDGTTSVVKLNNVEIYDSNGTKVFTSADGFSDQFFSDVAQTTGTAVSTISKTVTNSASSTDAQKVVLTASQSLTVKASKVATMAGYSVGTNATLTKAVNMIPSNVRMRLMVSQNANLSGATQLAALGPSWTDGVDRTTSGSAGTSDTYYVEVASESEPGFTFHEAHVYISNNSSLLPNGDFVISDTDTYSAGTYYFFVEINGTPGTLSNGSNLTTGVNSVTNTTASRTVSVTAATGESFYIDEDGEGTEASGGDITAVLAGDGLTGGSTSGSAELAVGEGTGISVSTNAVGLTNTGVSAGTYTNTNLTVDAQGRITAASNGSSGAGATNLSTTTATNQITINSSTGTNAVIGEATGSIAGLMSTTHHNKLDGIAANANNYVHPTFAGDDINIDTGALTGATVISDLDFNITTNTNGHVTDANASVATRTLTLANLGYTGSTNADNYSGWHLYLNNTFQESIGSNERLGFDNGTGITASYDGSNDVSFSLATAGPGAGTYGSTANGTKIDQITLDAYGRVTAISTGPTGTATVNDTGTPAITSNGSLPLLSTGISAAEIRDLIGAGTSSSTGTVTSVTGGTGLSGTVTSSGSLDLDSDLSGTVNKIGGTAAGTNYFDMSSNTQYTLRLGSSNPQFLWNFSGEFHANGDLIAFSTSVSSDEKLKENIRELKGSLDKTLKLRGVKFDWKKEEKPNNQLGFIAQEVEEILPELVTEVNSLGDKTGETHKVVNYQGVIPVLVEAIKELKAEIEELKNDNRK